MKYNPPVPEVAYAGVTFEQVIEALTDILDGENLWDLQAHTGLTDERCREILNIHAALMKNRNPYA